MALPDRLSSLLQETYNCTLDPEKCSASEVEVSSQETLPDTSVLVQMAIMSVSCSLGLIGNIFAICLLAATAKIHIMSRYVIGRAIADILLLMTVPLDTATNFHMSWIFGTVLCKLRCALTLLSPFVSSVFQVGMCANIYIEVCRSGPHMKLRAATFKIMAIISWFLFLTFGISIFIQSEILIEVISGRLHCISLPLMQDTASSLALRVVAICLIFLVPVAISWVFVILIIPHKKSPITYSSRQMASGVLKAEIQLKQFLLAISLAFTVCQAPYWLPYLVLELAKDVHLVESIMAVFPITMSLPAINAVINSVLYLVFMKDIQKVVKKMQNRITKDQPMIPLLPIT